MADSRLFRFELQLHDAMNRQCGRRVVRFSSQYTDTIETVALRLLAACSLSGDRCVVPAASHPAPRPDLVYLTDGGVVARWVSIEPSSVTTILRAADQADDVVVLFGCIQRAVKWWSRYRRRLMRVEGLSVQIVEQRGLSHLCSVLTNRMSCHCTIDGSDFVLCIGSALVPIETLTLNDHNDLTQFALRA